MDTDALLDMYREPLFAGGHHLAVHWHPGRPHSWVGNWRVSIGIYYVRTCVCGAYERWGADNGC